MVMFLLPTLHTPLAVVEGDDMKLSDTPYFGPILYNAVKTHINIYMLCLERGGARMIVTGWN